MFTPEEIQGRLHEQPFVPLRVVTSSGQMYDIPHPDLVFVGQSSLYIGVGSNENPTYFDTVSRVAIMHITDLQEIVTLELAKVSKRLSEKNLNLVLSEEAKELLIKKGSSVEYGARPLRRAIEQNLEDPLSEDLLRGTFHGKDTINVVVREENGEDKLFFEPSNSKQPELAVAK